MSHNIPFENLSESDLVVDAIYEGGSQGHMGAEPIHKILPGISTQSGFRVRKIENSRALVVLYSSLNITQTGYANPYANALRDSNRLNLVQNVTTSIACHLLLSRRDYRVCGMLCVCRAEPRFLQIRG